MTVAKRGKGVWMVVLIALGLGVAVELSRAVLNPLGLRFTPWGGKNSPDFTGTTLKGERWVLSDHLGKRPVLVNFFATWCGPCKMEYPDLVVLHEKFGKQGLQIVMLSEESKDIVAKDEQAAAAPWTVLVEASPVFQAYRVGPIPRTIYYDATGHQAADIAGYDPSRLEAVHQSLAQWAAGVK